MRGVRAKLPLLLAVVAALCALPLLTACDERGRTEYSESRTATVYVYSVEETEGETVVRVSASETENVLATASCVAEEYYHPDGAFYQADELTLTLAAEDVRAAVDGYFAENGIPAPAGGLKLYFDYATMNGRVLSDGEVAVSDGYYIHTAEEDAEGNLTLGLTLRSEYYPAWYAVAAGVALSVIVIAAAAVVCAKALGKKG